MSPTVATDREVLRAVGARLRAAREAAELTMVETATRTGLSRKTVQRAEAGDNPTLLTVVRLLRLYRRLDAFDDFLAPPEISPMALLKATPRKKGDDDG